jgi:hypothetical protein
MTTNDQGHNSCDPRRMSHRRREWLDYFGVLLGLVGGIVLWYHADPRAVIGGLALLGGAFYLLVATRMRQP